MSDNNIEDWVQFVDHDEDILILDGPANATLCAMAILRRTMLKHPEVSAIAAAMPQDELDELTAGVPMGHFVQWLTDVALALYARKDDDPRPVLD